MHDISEMMKTLKSRYTISYNSRHGRVGTLWSERFKSVLFEKGSAAMLTVARYIDLNAVRAGIVANPKDYRWCGYSEACQGTKRAVAGIEMIESFMNPRRRLSKNEAITAYAALLCVGGHAIRKGCSKEEVAELFKLSGEISESTATLCRIRHFELGLIIGGKAFVNAMCVQFRLNGSPTEVFSNTEVGGFWIARKYRHEEIIGA